MLLTFQAIAQCMSQPTKKSKYVLYNKGIIPNSISTYHHPSCKECTEEGRSIDVNHTSNLKDSFICPDSGSRFCGFPYADERQLHLQATKLAKKLLTWRCCCVERFSYRDLRFLKQITKLEAYQIHQNLHTS